MHSQTMTEIQDANLNIQNLCAIFITLCKNLKILLSFI
jgi:hypothetical protein